MQRYEPPRCTYCESVTTFSAERADAIETGEGWTCPDCDGQTGRWEGDMATALESEMAWVGPEPLM